MAPTLEPSLPRLLAIEDNFDNVQDQLHQAARLVGLSSGWDEPHFEDHGSESGSQHRAEWVLRWLLEKIKELGNSASLSPKSWILLRRMIQRVPVSNAARLLNSHQILSIIEKVLERMLQVDGEMDEYSATPDSRKRKRSSATAGDSGDRFEISAVCSEIERLLFLIRSLAENHDGRVDSVGREHMKAVLRTNTQQAARLLGLWYSVLRKCLSSDVSLDDRIKKETLHAMLHVWESRSLDADDEHGWSSSAFVSEVFIYGSLLYSDYLLDSTDGKDKTGLIRSFERLLARHVLIPARSAFLYAHRSPTTTTGFAMAKVVPFFHPLKTEIEKGPPDTREIPYNRDPACSDRSRNPLRKVIPTLLELAIDILSPTSIKQKIEDEAWIETLFIVLAECAGLQIPEAPPASIPRSLNTVSLLDLLFLIKERKRKLSSGLMQRILATYSGLVAVQEREADDETPYFHWMNEDGPVIRWDLIEAVLEIDGSIFTPTTDAPNQRNEATTIFADRLLQNISRKRFPSWDEDWRSQHCDLPWPVADVINLLMQAYASGRDLAGFLTSWYEGLRSCIDDLSTCAWSGDRITWFLSSLLEDSMTPNQIVGFLELRVRVLETTNLDSTADIIIIDAILQSISKDETIDRAVPILKRLQDLLANDLRAKRSLDTGLPTGDLLENDHHIDMWHWRGWRILTRTYQLLSEGEDPATAMATKQDLTSNLPLNWICQYIQNTTLEDPGPSPVYAFNFVMMAASSMLNTPELRDIAEQHVLGSLQSLSSEVLEAWDSKSLASLWPEEELTLKKRLILARIHDFIAVILQFPQVFQIIDSTRRVFLVVELLFQARSWPESSPPYIHLTTDWKDIIAALHEIVLTLGCPHLRNDYVQGLSKALQHQIGTDLALGLVLRLPPSAIQRKDREQLLDRIFDRIGDHIEWYRSKSTLLQCNESAIAAATRLLEAPCLTSKLCSDPASVLYLVEGFDQVEQAKAQKTSSNVERQKVKPLCVEHLRNLLVMVFKQVASDANLERRQRYLENFVSEPLSKYTECAVQAIQECAKAPQAEMPDVTVCFPEVYQATLSALFSTVEDWGDASKEIRKLAEPISSALTDSLPTLFTLLEARGITVDGPQFGAMFNILSIIAPLKPDMVRSAEAGKDWRRLLIENLMCERNSQHDAHTVPIEAIGCFWHGVPLLESFEGCRLLLKSNSDPQSQSKVLSYWESLVIAEKSQLEIANVLEVTWLDQPETPNLELRRILIKAFKPLQDSRNDSEDTVEKSLAGLLSKLCGGLRGAPSVGQFCALLASIHTIIREKVRDTLIFDH